jgi:hypothetical protein
MVAVSAPPKAASLLDIGSTDPDHLHRVLDDDGKVLPGATVPAISDATLLKIFDTMLLVRIMDDRMMRLQRQGRLGFYMKSIGEEASHFAVAALQDGDWIYPSYREPGAWFWRGYTIEQFINQLFGNEADPTLGRQMPVHHSANWLNVVSVSSPVGTQIPQAVGSAYAAKVLGKPDVSMVYFGEGTSSTGEFHVGMNFAGVWKAPCIFVCRNNGWAISVPLEKQCAAKTFASKAVGYGMPGIRVDGNDILAMYQVAEGGDRPGPRRRGPDAHRGADLSRAGALVVGRSERVPGRRCAGRVGEEGSAQPPARLHEDPRPVERGARDQDHRGLQPAHHRRAGRRRQAAGAADRHAIHRRLRGAAVAPARAAGVPDDAGSQQEPAPPRVKLATYVCLTSARVGAPESSLQPRA